MNKQKVQIFKQILYWSLKAKNALKLVSMYLKENMQNQTISELYTDDKKTTYSSNPNAFLKSAKNLYEKLYTKRQPPKLPLLNSKTATSELFSKIPNRMKISN